MKGLGVVILIILLVLSVFGNIFLFQKWHGTLNSDPLAPLRAKYPLLSGRAINPNGVNALIVNFLPLRKQVHKIVDPYGSSFAVYFEYIPTGTTIGVNEDRNFTAESLLKVPVVMAYYHKKEVMGIKTDPTVAITQSELNT